jgi:hypothetical protein
MKGNGEGSYFNFNRRRKSKNKTVSFITMVEWYNGCFMPPHGHGFDIELSKSAKRLDFKMGDMISAINSKLYSKVYLRPTKDKGILAHKHIVKFC